MYNANSTQILSKTEGVPTNRKHYSNNMVWYQNLANIRKKYRLIPIMITDAKSEKHRNNLSTASRLTHSDASWTDGFSSQVRKSGSTFQKYI